MSDLSAFGQHLAELNEAADGVFNPVYAEYTILSVETHGVEENEAQRRFFMAGAIFAERLCTAIAGERSSTSYHVIVPGNVFSFVRCLDDTLIDWDWPHISYHGKLQDWFTSKKGTPDEVVRVANAKRILERQRERRDRMIGAVDPHHIGG